MRNGKALDVADTESIRASLTQLTVTVDKGTAKTKKNGIDLTVLGKESVKNSHGTLQLASGVGSFEFMVLITNK